MKVIYLVCLLIFGIHIAAGSECISTIEQLRDALDTPTGSVGELFVDGRTAVRSLLNFVLPSGPMKILIGRSSVGVETFQTTFIVESWFLVNPVEVRRTIELDLCPEVLDNAFVLITTYLAEAYKTSVSPDASPFMCQITLHLDDKWSAQHYEMCRYDGGIYKAGSLKEIVKTWKIFLFGGAATFSMAAFTTICLRSVNSFENSWRGQKWIRCTIYTVSLLLIFLEVGTQCSYFAALKTPFIGVILLLVYNLTTLVTLLVCSIIYPNGNIDTLTLGLIFFFFAISIIYYKLMWGIIGVFLDPEWSIPMMGTFIGLVAFCAVKLPDPIKQAIDSLNSVTIIRSTVNTPAQNRTRRYIRKFGRMIGIIVAFVFGFLTISVYIWLLFSHQRQSSVAWNFFQAAVNSFPPIVMLVYKYAVRTSRNGYTPLGVQS